MAFLRMFYGVFLVFLTPLSVPLTIILFMVGQVDISTWALFTFFYIINAIGISIGFHRLLAHKSFQTFSVIKIILLIFGCTAMQGPPLAWACLHRQHHLHADTSLDPHSPIHGFWHAHCLWIFKNYKPQWRRYGRDLLGDKSVVWVSKHYDIFALSGLLIPFLLASWEGLIIAGFLRLFLTSQNAFFLNSISHLLGKQPNKQNNSSGNHWLTALLCFGEGWHNNHHAQPRAAYHGWRWYQIDPMGTILKLLLAMKLVWNVQIVNKTN